MLLQQGSNGQSAEGRRGSHNTSTAPLRQGPAVQPSGNMPQPSASSKLQPGAALQQKRKRKRTADAAVEGSGNSKLARQGSSNSPGAAAMNQAGGGGAAAAVAAAAVQPSSPRQLRPRLHKRLTEDAWFQEDDTWMDEQ